MTVHCVLDGTSDDLTAKTPLLTSTPPEYDGLAHDECALEPIVVDTADGTGNWDCRVRCVAPEQNQPQVGQSGFSFDTCGGTPHITQSLQTVASYAPRETVPDGVPAATDCSGGRSRAPSASRRRKSRAWTSPSPS